MNARVAKYKSYSNTSDENYQKWIEFTTEFEEYFLSNEEKWDINLERLQDYMDQYERRPSEQDADPDVRKLGQWVSDQQQHYRKRQHIMKNQVYYQKWYELITNSRHNIYF